MASPRTVLVINPQSQNGALRRKWPRMARIIRRELSAFEEVYTAAPGDATRLAREAIEAGADRVVAVGGDGTINEVVNGFFRDGAPVSATAALGVIPFGTGGDFRRTLGIADDTAEAARVLARGHTRAIDVGALALTTRDGQPQARVFANIASFGMSGMVDRLVNESSKRLGGRISFFLATARANLRYTNKRVRLVFDENPHDAVDMTISTLAVANGRYFGGGMRIAPHAELDDGYFDVVAVGDVGLKEMLLHGHRIYRGTHLTLDKVSHRRARVVRAEPVDDDVELDVDGETPGVLPATFTILPAALPVVAPAGSQP